MTSPPEPLTATLRLLFDGKEPKAIAAAIAAAIDESTLYAVCDAMPVAVPIGYGRGWFLDAIAEWEPQLEFVGTDADMLGGIKELERQLQNGDTSDYAHEQKDEIISQWLKDGIVREVPDTKVT